MKIKFSLTGTSPLIIQSDTLVDPLNPLKKQIASYTKKRQKTDEDHATIARLEWEGALYFEPGLGPYIPSENIAASIRDGGKLTKNGTNVERALIMDPAPAQLLYRGPRDIESLFAEERFQFKKSVVVERKRVIRVRPIFREWSLEAEADLLEDLLDFDVLQRVAKDAGNLMGLGTYRRGGYGHYDAVVEKL